MGCEWRVPCHELFRRIPVLRLGTTRALEAAQKRASSLQLDLVNSMAVLETLRLAQHRRTHVCFTLWKVGMERRKGMEAMQATYIKRLMATAQEKAYYLWREEVSRRKRSRRIARRVIEKMLGKKGLLTAWLKWRQVVADTLHEDNNKLTETTEDLRGELDEANRLLARSREETEREFERAENEKRRADAEHEEASGLRRKLTAAEKRIKELEAQLERMRSAADDASAASIVASARNMLGRCSLYSSRLRLMASMHTPDPRVLLTAEDSAKYGDDCKAVRQMPPSQILMTFTNRCREMSRRLLESTGPGDEMSATAYKKALDFLENVVPDLRTVNQRHLAAVLETVGLVGQGQGIKKKADTLSKATLRQQGLKGKIELPEDMWAAAEAAQELLDAVEAAAGWPTGEVVS